MQLRYPVFVHIYKSAHGGDQTSNIWISRSIGFSDRSFVWRGLRIHTWKTCMRIWGLPWKLVGNFGSRNCFQSHLLRPWMMYTWNEGIWYTIICLGVCTHIGLRVCMHMCISYVHHDINMKSGRMMYKYMSRCVYAYMSRCVYAYMHFICTLWHT